MKFLLEFVLLACNLLEGMHKNPIHWPKILRCVEKEVLFSFSVYKVLDLLKNYEDEMEKIT